MTPEPQQNIRNFSIIAHINHGKSTLADRFLEITQTLRRDEMREQVLDQMELERERGITIKLQPCTMHYRFQGRDFQLNLIDTPGHMDFAYEVERSLSAVEGAVLLVDVTSGIQAQTLANLRLAQAQKLKIIPVINKIDICPSPTQFAELKRDLAELLGLSEEKVLAVSAKTGQGVEILLQRIIQEIPSPKLETDPLKALIFDSFYDQYQGVIACVRVFQGAIKKREQLFLLNQQKQFLARELGIFKPERVPMSELGAGRIGYVATGIKRVLDVRIGETITGLADAEIVTPLSGYQEPKSLLFANLFPAEGQTFETFKANIEKLRLNDTSLTFEPINHPYLGQGLRAGFLGILHLEITLERLKREYDTQAMTTSPSVAFLVKLRDRPEMIFVHSPAELPGHSEIDLLKEPWVKLDVLTPLKYASFVHQLVEQKRGNFVAQEPLDINTHILHFEVPLSEIIEDFLDKLKSVSEGFASFSYEFSDYRQGDMRKLEFLVSREPRPALSKIVHKDKVQKEAESFLKKLKQTLPPKNFAQALQARLGAKIIAREDIRALRKDVTAPLYGGDFTRKKKLLQKQRRGKKRLEREGVTHIPPDVYLKLLKK